MVVTFVDPTTTQEVNTQKVLSILPPIQELPPPPTPQISRPIDDHGSPHNTPPIQQQIQQTAQPYRPHQPIDDRPTGIEVGSNSLRGSNEIRSGNLGVDFAMNNGQQAIGSELAYEANWYLSGLLNGLFPNSQTIALEDSLYRFSPEYGFYELGKIHSDLVQDAIDNAREIVDNLRDNPPHFEMPQLKIPKLELPQIPEIKLPELPEFKLPEFKFPEFKDKDQPNPFPKIPRPKPIPKDLTRQLRELELSECGNISFGIAYAVKTISPNPDADNIDNQYIEEQSSLDEMFAINTALYGQGFDDKVSFFESSGSTGSIYYQDMGGGVSYRYYGRVGTYAYYTTGYPYYYASGGVIEVTGIKSSEALNKILDKFSEEKFKPEVYKINVSHLDAKDCPLGKPPPPPPPPPPAPDQDCDCMAQCCPDIDYRKIRAIIEEELKKLDLVAAIPMSWQIRNEGGKPQLVIQCAEENGVDENGNKKYKSAMYPISVPHWDGTASDKISLPSYIKGNYEGIYTLNDNSKVTINAQNEIECRRIINAIKPHIPKQYTTDAYFKGGIIVRDKPIKESRVKPRYGRYFKDGQKNNKPNWRIDFT